MVTILIIFVVCRHLLGKLCALLVNPRLTWTESLLRREGLRSLRCPASIAILGHHREHTERTRGLLSLLLVVVQLMDRWLLHRTRRRHLLHLARLLHGLHSQRHVELLNHWAAVQLGHHLLALLLQLLLLWARRNVLLRLQLLLVVMEHEKLLLEIHCLLYLLLLQMLLRAGHVWQEWLLAAGCCGEVQGIGGFSWRGVGSRHSWCGVLLRGLLLLELEVERVVVLV